MSDYRYAVVTHDRARHAWAHLTDLGRTRPEPSHYAEFGPRGGITIAPA